MLAHILQHVRQSRSRPWISLQHSSLFLLFQNMYFSSSSPGINFTHQNMGWGGCFFLLPFPASDCAEDSRKRQTWEARRSNPIRTAEFLSVVPKTFYALLHHRVAADFLPLTPPPTEECLLWGGRVHISFSCHANSLIL